MPESETVIAAAVAATAIIFFLFWMKRNGANDAGKRFPPTAPVLPLIGAILRRGMIDMPNHFMKSAGKLGPVISYNFGGRQVVILNGKEAITEAFLKQSEAFADRPPFWTESNILNRNLRGLIFVRYNDTFKKYHKLCLTIMKEFGFGVKNVSEIRILREVESLIENILKVNGRPFDPKSLTSASIFSVFSNILFGEKFTRSDSCSRLSEACSEFVRNIGFAVDQIPLLRFLPTLSRKISALDKSQKDIFSIIEEGIEYSKSSEYESTFVRRFIEIQGSNYDHQDLLYIIRDLGIASADTVTITLMWAMIELANHPEIQNRFQKEIDEVVPKNRLPSLDDEPRLPYTQAMILEVMRRHTLAPLYVPHFTLKDAEVLRCHIPRGSTVLANAFSAHMDPKFWKDPENFRPERFLDEENKITGSEHVIAFGLGKRSCIGEILGRQQTFLYLTSLIQRFDIRPPEGQDSIRVKEVMAMVVMPSEFELRMIPRDKDQGS